MAEIKFKKLFGEVDGVEIWNEHKVNIPGLLWRAGTEERLKKEFERIFSTKIKDLEIIE